jgi:hypothetical protein
MALTAKLQTQSQTPSYYRSLTCNRNYKHSFHTTFQTVVINIFLITGQQSNRFSMGPYIIYSLQISLIRYYSPPDIQKHANAYTIYIYIYIYIYIRVCVCVISVLFKCAKVQSLNCSAMFSYYKTFHLKPARLHGELKKAGRF